MSFADRISQAETHEQNCQTKITDTGWTVGQYGQACLTKDVRDALRWIDTPIRWMADHIAIRGPVACLADAKWSNRQDTPNYDIECSSLASLGLQCESLGIPVVIIWYDFQCNYTWDLLPDHAPKFRGPWRGNGSGTPFWLWPKDQARPFGDVFGA